MKWLVLIFLISCGHETPPAQDVGDSDGDHIPNYLETNGELAKYVAEIIPFGEVRATMNVRTDNKYFSIELENKVDLVTESFKLATKSQTALRKDEYYTEFSRLFVTRADTFEALEDEVEVSLLFKSRERNGYLLLTDGKEENLIGRITSRMAFRLSQKELENLISGKIYFQLRRTKSADPYSMEGNIRERTYRIYIYDGKAAKIHYVSKDLPFERYLKLSGIAEHFELKGMRGFSHSEPEVFWWSRTLSDGDRVLVRTSIKNLSAFHLKNFEKKESSIARNNGRSGTGLKVVKNPSTKFVLKLRGIRETHDFGLSEKKWSIGGGRGEILEDCRGWERKITRTKTTEASKDLILSELILKSEEKTLTFQELRDHVTEGRDSKGMYLELALDITPENFEIIIPDRPAATYHKTGRYKTMCTHYSKPLYGGTDTNEEGQLKVYVESYIEKID